MDLVDGKANSCDEIELLESETTVLYRAHANIFRKRFNLFTECLARVTI